MLKIRLLSLFYLSRLAVLCRVTHKPSQYANTKRVNAIPSSRCIPNKGWDFLATHTGGVLYKRGPFVTVKRHTRRAGIKYGIYHKPPNNAYSFSGPQPAAVASP